MPVVGYPSPLSPTVPAITVTLPDSWRAALGGGALFRAHDGRGGEHAPELAAYVITTTYDTADAVLAEFAAEAQARNDGESDPVFDVDLDGRTWAGLNLSWTDDGHPVFVVHLVTAAGRHTDPEVGEVTQFVRLSGWVAGPAAESDYEALQAVMETARVTVPELEQPVHGAGE